MNILFFMDSLSYGGKERRMLELIQYLKQNTSYSLALVLTDDLIYYDYVYDMGVQIEIIKRVGIKYDPLLFIKFYRFCVKFKPDIIHSWGKMTTFYSIPSKLLLRIPLLSNLVSDTTGGSRFSINTLFFKTDMLFSDIVLSNSKAGLDTYKIKTPKAKVIWNGVHLERFGKSYDLKRVREELKVSTEFMIVMIAAFSTLKDYDLFLDVAKEIAVKRQDCTFVGVGDGSELSRIKQRIKDENILNIVLPGKQKNVERIIAASDIGLLCTYSEGISNSIIEFMAMGKPVIATDINGGSKEIIVNGETGFCTDRKPGEIAAKLISLLDNRELCRSMGYKGKERIFAHFSIQRMGEEFRNLYESLYLGRKKR